MKRWDTHWQLMYFYREPIRLELDTPIEIRCEFDTRTATVPVTPGWGTANEMCLTVLYLVAPARPI